MVVLIATLNATAGREVDFRHRLVPPIPDCVEGGTGPPFFDRVG